MVKVNPMIEKPLPWILFGIGFGINVFIITDKSFANYVLPVYMFFAANSIAVIQIIHRQKNNIKESWY
jgi:hypothetical protein